MKKSSLRFVCLFIILIFCLAPLSAIDLNQDNNTKHISQDDDESDISVNELNISAENDEETYDADVACGIDNETQNMNSSNSVDGEIAADENVEEINENDNLTGVYEPITIHVDDIMEGETAFIEIQTEDFINAGVYVSCHGKSTFLWLNHGYASMTISGLAPGTYKVEVSGQDTPLKNSTSFSVKRSVDPNLSLQVKDIMAGEMEMVEVHIDKKYTGEVVLKLDDSQIRTLTVKDGSAYAVFNDLKSGQHTVEATSSATPGFTPCQKTATFTVSDVPYLDATIDEITEGEKLNVKVQTVKDFDGIVVCLLDDGPWQLGNAKNGVFSCSFNDKTFLTPGNHTMTVYTFVSEKYKSNQKSFEFHVKAKD